MVKDINKAIASFKIPGDYIYIMRDLNEKIGQNQLLMASVCTQQNLYYVLLALNLGSAMIPTYIRLSKHFDYLLLSCNTPTPNNTGL